MVVAAFDDQGAIRTRRQPPTELSVIDDFSASLVSTLRSLSLSATASSTALHSTLHQLHSFTAEANSLAGCTAQANSLAGNTRAPTCPAPGEENVPPESTPSAAHGNFMELDDDSCSSCESVKRARCLKRETRRPHALKVDKPNAVPDLHSLPADTPMTRLVKTHLRSQRSFGVSTPAAAPHGGLAARVDLSGARQAHGQLGKRPFARLAISAYAKRDSKGVRPPHAPPRAGSSPRRRNVKWGRAGAAPFVGTPTGRMLAAGRPEMIFLEDVFLRWKTFKTQLLASSLNDLAAPLRLVTDLRFLAQGTSTIKAFCERATGLKNKACTHKSVVGAGADKLG
ncbi:hypothetical protein T484DRAFT_1885212 [Baffinella frigidus]|nr:hypothetical protein T484DRAFT_1885212 [Cryptophyta sp. CCMP2293]